MSDTMQSDAVFLSRVVLRPRGVRGSEALRDAYAVHQALWRAFPGWSRASDGETLRRDSDGVTVEGALFLWRADRLRDEDGAPMLKLLVQSRVAPDWSPLDSLTADDAPQIRSLRWSIEQGATHRFYLRGNPTRARKDAKQPVEVQGELTTYGALTKAQHAEMRGKRVAIWSAEDRLAWLTRKLGDAGLRIARRQMTDASDETVRSVDVSAVRTSEARPWRWQRPGEQAHATHEGVDFEGLIEVVDAGALKHALTRGIGSAKSMGFGLLSLAPFPGVPA